MQLSEIEQVECDLAIARDHVRACQATAKQARAALADALQAWWAFDTSPRNREELQRQHIAAGNEFRRKVMAGEAEADANISTVANSVLDATAAAMGRGSSPRAAYGAHRRGALPRSRYGTTVARKVPSEL
jgi:hypothetical protein